MSDIINGYNCLESPGVLSDSAAIASDSPRKRFSAGIHMIILRLG